MAHTYDTKANLPRGRSSAGRDLNYTCGAGATLLTLAICVQGLTARTGGAPTFNGVAMIQADQNRYYAGSGETISELWYMLDPPTGTQYVIHIPDDNNLYITAEASSYKAQAGYKTKLRTANGNSGSSTNPTGPALTGLAAGDVIVACVGNGATTWNPTGRTGVQLYDVDDGSYGDGAQYYICPNPNNVAMAWTFGSSFTWGLVEAAFQEYYEKVIDGAIDFSFTPGATIEQILPDIVGSVAFSLTPGATVETQMPVKYLVERGQVVVNMKLSEYGSRMLPYAVDESGIIANTERPPAQDFYVDGNVLFSMASGSQAIAEYVYQGNIGFSPTPQATVTREWVVQGAIDFSLMPAATVTREWTIQGNIPLSFLPGSQFLPDYVQTGAVSLALAPGSQSFPEYVWPGAIALSLLPGATSIPEYVIAGDVSFSLAPQASVTRDWTIQGDILFSLTPSHTVTREWVITGAISFSLVPNSSYYTEGPSEYIIYGNVSMSLMPGASVTGELPVQGDIQFSLSPGASSIMEALIQGNIPLSFVPGASSIMEAVVQGNIPLSLLLGASSIFEITIQGGIPLSLIPGASSIFEAMVQGGIQVSLIPGAIVSTEVAYQGDISFALVPHSSSTFAVEWEVIGNIAFALYLTGIEKFVKPEGRYGYDWDPSKHFFVKGQTYDASLEFGLDKRFPIQEGGEYKYDA